MKISLLIIIWFWVSIPEPREDYGKWESSQEESYIKFNIRNLGLNVEGIFNSFTTTVNYNKSQPAKSSFSAKIQVNSINTGINLRDNHLKKEEYFHAEKYPTITFQSKSVSSPSTNRLKVKGDLTIKGKTLPVELEVEVSEAGGKTQFSITCQIDRKDFGVGGSSWTMSDDVYLDLYVEN